MRSRRTEIERETDDSTGQHTSLDRKPTALINPGGVTIDTAQILQIESRRGLMG